MSGRDVVGMARTGSGKTAAFLVPMLEKLKLHTAKTGIRAIILSPSRELAIQTLKFAKELGKHTDLRLCLLVGGDNLEDQFAALARNPDMFVALGSGGPDARAVCVRADTHALTVAERYRAPAFSASSPPRAG